MRVGNKWVFGLVLAVLVVFLGSFGPGKPAGAAELLRVAPTVVDVTVSPQWIYVEGRDLLPDDPAGPGLAVLFGPDDLPDGELAEVVDWWANSTADGIFLVSYDPATGISRYKVELPAVLAGRYQADNPAGNWQSVRVFDYNGEEVPGNQYIQLAKNLALPRITGVTPGTAPAGGGATVRVSTTGILASPANPPLFYFGAALAAVVPAGETAAGTTGGEWDVRVPGFPFTETMVTQPVDLFVVDPITGAASPAIPFTYTRALPGLPVTLTISPETVPAEGGSKVLIKAPLTPPVPPALTPGFSGFASPDGTLPQVFFGHREGTVCGVTTEDGPDGQGLVSVLEVITPPHPAGVVDIRVVVPHQGEVFLRDQFTYATPTPAPDNELPAIAPAVIAKAVDKHTVRLSWPAVPKAQTYEVSVGDSRNGVFRLDSVVPAAAGAGDHYFALVRGLEAERKYWFRVQAVCPGGKGPCSEPVSTVTATSGEGWAGFKAAGDLTDLLPGGGGQLVIRKTPVAPYYQLAAGASANQASRAVTFVPEAQRFDHPVLLDNNTWKVGVFPLTLRYNTGNLGTAAATIEVSTAAGPQTAQALRVNPHRRPLSRVATFKLTLENKEGVFTPAVYSQPFQLTLAYQNLPAGRYPVMYYYDGATRAWLPLAGTADRSAVTAPVSRPGLYAVFAD